MHDHVGQRDLLDATPLLLDNDHVVEPQRTAERNLQSGDDVAEQRIGCERRDRGNDTGRRDHARAEQAYLAECRQGDPDAEDGDHGDRDATQHHHLRPDRADVPVVFDIGPQSGQRALFEYEEQRA